MMIAGSDTIIVKHCYNTPREKHCILSAFEWFGVFHRAARCANFNPKVLHCPRCWQEFTVYASQEHNYQFCGELEGTVRIVAEDRQESGYAVPESTTVRLLSEL